MQSYYKTRVDVIVTRTARPSLPFTISPPRVTTLHVRALPTVKLLATDDVPPATPPMTRPALTPSPATPTAVLLVFSSRLMVSCAAVELPPVRPPAATPAAHARTVGHVGLHAMALN